MWSFSLNIKTITNNNLTSIFMPTGSVLVGLKIITMITLILKTYVYGAKMTKITDETALTTRCKNVS